MDGTNKKGRPRRRGADDLVDWCNKDVYTLHGLVSDRRRWSRFVKYVVDTNGHWAHGAKEEEEVNRRPVTRTAGNKLTLLMEMAIQPICDVYW